MRDSLSNEQREKLLEICRIVYPEYPIISMSANYVLFQTERKRANRENGNWSMHWFQLVFLYLVSRIQDKMSDDQAWEDQPPYVGNVFGWEEGRRWTFWSKFMWHYPKACNGGNRKYPQNPIDYLYDVCKKCKFI